VDEWGNMRDTPTHIKTQNQRWEAYATAFNYSNGQYTATHSVYWGWEVKNGAYNLLEPKVVPVPS
jgi:hypothetical protein